MNTSKLLFFILAFVIILSFFLVACTSSDDDDDDSAGDDDDDTGSPDDDDDNDDDNDDDTVDPPPGCDIELKEGINGNFDVNGVNRSFFLDLPEGVEESWPWPVVFNWHGFGDTASNMRSFVTNQVDNATMPFIAITPDDLNLLWDWDLAQGTNPENREALFFDAVLDAVDKCYGVDWDRVYCMGFSFGGGVCDMLGVLRGDVIASIGTFSGVYGSNPANALVYGVMFDWPELTTSNKYVELRPHGGSNDSMILPFGQYAVNDQEYLNANGHDVVICNHGQQHNYGPSYFGVSNMITFFNDHPLGTTSSPYASGFPDGFPDYCEFEPKQ